MKKKVLIAEDFETLSKLIRNSLKSLDVEFIEAFDGKEAVSKARANRPDLVIMDVGMPKVNGYEATRQIRADVNIKDIPILILTATGDEDTAMRAGATDFMTKPYSPSELKTRAARMLGLADPR